MTNQSSVSTSSSSVPVVSAVSLSLGVGGRVDECPEEELEEGDDPPEEVSDGVETPRLALENSSIRCDVHHDHRLSLVVDFYKL